MLPLLLVIVGTLGFLLWASEVQQRDAAEEAFEAVADQAALTADAWWGDHLRLQRAVAFDTATTPDRFRAALSATYVDFALLLDGDGRVVATYPERDDLLPGDELAGDFPHIDAVLAGADVGIWATDQAVTESGRVVATAVPAGRAGGVMTVAFDLTSTSLPDLLSAAMAQLVGGRVALVEPGTGVVALPIVSGGEDLRSLTRDTASGWRVEVTAPSQSVDQLVGGTTNLPGRVAFTLVSLLLTAAWWRGPAFRQRARGQRLRADRADALFDDALTPTMVLDPGNIITRANHAMMALTGLPEHQIIGQNADALLEWDHPSGSVAGSLTTSPLPSSREVHFRTADGSERYGRLSSAPVRAPDGSLAGHVAQLVDLTDLRRAQSALQDSREELRQFAFRVAHDLRNPLAAQRGLANLLVGDSLDQETRQEVAERLAISSRAASELVAGLLAQADRVGADEVEANDLAELVDWLRQMTGATLAEVNGTIELRGDVAVIETSSTALRTILLNLVSNSLTYRRPDAPPVVTIEATAVADGVQVSVIDNGLGVPDGDYDRIFEPGARGHTDVDEGGHGSGLAEVRRLVTMAGGRVWAEPGPNDGLAVCVVLPPARVPSS